MTRPRCGFSTQSNTNLHWQQVSIALALHSVLVVWLRVFGDRQGKVVHRALGAQTIHRGNLLHHDQKILGRNDGLPNPKQAARPVRNAVSNVTKVDQHVVAARLRAACVSMWIHLRTELQPRPKRNQLTRSKIEWPKSAACHLTYIISTIPHTRHNQNIKPLCTGRVGRRAA